MKKKKYLEFYYDCMKSGELPRDGLCHCFDGYKDELELFIPTEWSGGYWGYYYEFFDSPVMTQDVDVYTKHQFQFAFNPLRQNIVLFLAAINNEL